jgi:hypothetical protein
METFGPNREQSMLNHPSNYNNSNTNQNGNKMTENTSPWEEFLIDNNENTVPLPPKFDTEQYGEDQDDEDHNEYNDEEYDRMEIAELLADESRYLAEYEQAAAKREKLEAFKASGMYTDEHIKPEITVEWESLTDQEKKIYYIKHRIALAKWKEDLEMYKRQLAEAPTKIAYYEALVADVETTGPVFMTTHPCV